MTARLVGWFLWAASAFQRGEERQGLVALAREVETLQG
jgi:hypothetical protein